MKNLLIISLLVLSFISCSKNNDTPNELLDLISVSSDGATKALVENICPVLDVTAPLTKNEIEFLYAVREDEKVVKDVTSKFRTLYPTSVPFTNISAAEATHISAIEMLLTYYEVTFPAQGAVGVFVDAKRQERYDKAVVQGTTLVAAYRAAATLEEECVAAYKGVVSTITNTNIKLIIENISRASSNHLRAYYRQITALGETYTPTVLDKASFDSIVNAEFGQGGKYGQKGGKGNGNTNSGKGGKGQGCKGTVDGNGNCTGTPVGGGGSASGNGGGAGKGYRGGK